MSAFRSIAAVRPSRVGAGLAALVAGVGSLGVASLAGAPAASAYGPATVITASCRVVGSREVCLLSGSGFGARVRITLTIHSTPTVLGTTESTASGTFGPYSATLPCGLDAGPHTFIATDPSGRTASEAYSLPAVAGCIAVLTQAGTTTATAPAAAGPTAAAPTVAAAGGAGSLAFTGADVTLTTAVGAALVAVGGMVVTSSRRRRRHDWPSARG